MTHPLGFRRLHLAGLSGWTVKLHVWRRDRIKGDRHNHLQYRFGFLSVPLWGRFVDTRWLPTAGDEYEWVHCVSDDGYRTERVGWSGLEEVSQRRRWPLVPYRCRPTAIHSLRPVGRVGVTLVLFGPRIAGVASDVWRRA